LIMLNIPNLLTLFRLVLIPFILVAYYWPSESRFLWASGLFALAAATDWLDGFLARKLNQTTPFGAFLDPVADKVTVAVALVVLVESYSELWLTVPAIIIISREIVISALREWMAETGKRQIMMMLDVTNMQPFSCFCHRVPCFYGLSLCSVPSKPSFECPFRQTLRQGDRCHPTDRILRSTKPHPERPLRYSRRKFLPLP